MKRAKRHRLDITLEDIARECNITMQAIYADIKRKKLEKNNIESVMEYIRSKKQDIKADSGIIL